MADETNNVILEDKKVIDIVGQFFVPNYQRGYRWGESQVKTLLSDLWNKASASEKQVDYCLQPLVVRKRPLKEDGTQEYELIDGQQRLTTLYILFSYMKASGLPMAENKFTLDYETRPGTATFLKNMTESGADKNIDFYHIWSARKSIGEWFGETFSGDLSRQVAALFKLYTYIVEHVQVIWYEVGAGEDPNLLFTRLNIGRIKLTNAELIKALFLRRSDNVGDEPRQIEIAAQWDAMERQLCADGDEFWYFLTRSDPRKYPTRIEFLFDMMADKCEGEREEYFTFFAFDKLISDKGAEEVWREIVENFLRMKEWYEDKVFYHKIGYLISTGSQTMKDVFEMAKERRKSELEALLDARIAASIKKESRDSYLELSYDKPQDKYCISKMLLLFNVQSILNEKVYQRFPFSKYNNNEWSLEHIHAQQSEGLKTAEVQRDWMRTHLDSLKEISAEGENVELIAKMTAAIENETFIPQSDFEKVHSEVVVRLSAGTDLEYIHTLSNMALLTKGDNAALSNSTFDVKRNEIVRLDRKGAFIPYCTKMVFLKYYTPSKDNQVHFWGAKDRDAYLKAIFQVLDPYLPREEEEV